MSKKSGLQRTGDMARHAQAIKKIIQAALRGGWQAAVPEAVKHYWPYILTAAIVLLMLPIIVFTCLPSMLFGLGDSKTAATASAAREQYDGYERYCNEYLLQLYAEVTKPESNQTKQEVWKTERIGKPMEKNWFIVFHAVETGNDLNQISEATIREQIPKILVYEIRDKEPETSSDTASNNTTHQPETEKEPTKVLVVRYLSPQEYMEQHGYSEADKNWAQLMYRTIKEQESVSSEIQKEHLFHE